MKFTSPVLAAASLLVSVSGDHISTLKDKATIKKSRDASHGEAKRELWGANGKKGSSSVKRSYGNDGKYNCKATIAVANRASGTVSVLDANTGDLIKTIPMPRENSEPMYVTANSGRVFVGDRANDEIVVFDAAQDYKVIKIMPGGKGIFHMFADQSGTILWVNNDIDNTITVYDIVNLQPIKTISIPQDIVDDGGKPHDLIISFDGKFAFVTAIGLSGETDVLLKYDTSTYELVNRKNDLAKDPHVGLTFRNNKLYVAQQGGDVVSILDQEDLSEINRLTVPDAHGVLMFSSNDKVAYVSDISPADDGEVGIYAIDLNTNELLGSLTDGIPPTPHNIAGTGEKLFITHSGPTNNLVTIYTASVDNPIPVKVKTVEVGLNPFGLDFVESTCHISGLF